NLEGLPTRTIYMFEGAGVKLTLTFMTPALPDDLDVLSRPVTYVTYDFKAIDGKKHTLQAYFDSLPEIALNTPKQDVAFERMEVAGMSSMRFGSAEQT